MNEWVDVYDFPKYEVNEMGEIRNKKTKKKRKPQFNSKTGYYHVCLYDDNAKPITKDIHVLVLMSFYPVNKKRGVDKRYTVNHIDGNKTNNTLENLEWCTMHENMQHAQKMGLLKPNKTSVKVICLDNLQIFDSYTKAGKYAGSNEVIIRKVCDGESSHCKGKHFARLEDYENNCIPPYKGKFAKRYFGRIKQ